MQPHVLKEEAQTDQHETQRRILGRGPGSDLTGAAIAGLHPESVLIQSPCLLRRRVQVDQDEHQPSGASLHPSCSLVRRENPARDVCRELLFLRPITKRVNGAVALVALAQSTGATRLATDRARDERRDSTLREIGLDVNPIKSFVVKLRPWMIHQFTAGMFHDFTANMIHGFTAQCATPHQEAKLRLINQWHQVGCV